MQREKNQSSYHIKKKNKNKKKTRAGQYTRCDETRKGKSKFLTDTQKHSGKKSAALCRQLPEPVWKEISPHIFGIPLLKFFNKETDDAKISVSSPSWLLP